MSMIRFVASGALPGLPALLAQGGRQVLTPVEKPASKRSVVFEPWSEGREFTLDKATVPPKAAVLPQCETLFSFRKSRDADDPTRLRLQLEEPAPPPATVILGCRPCDARGFSVLDRPYLQGPFADPYYKARRESLTVISLTCPSGCNTCFCHWVGGGPSSPEGSDILMTAIEGGHILQAVTPRGEALLAGLDLEDGAPRFREAEEARKAAWKSLAPAPDIKAAPVSVASRFTDVDFWQEQTARCLSCGACTYFCPTCYCFTITDEGEGLSETGGRRLRSWDNCMSSLFTREASGHNPRTSKALRMRNRISHKFATYPENWGSFSCNGCGRCISNCPVCLDIRAIVLAALDKGADA